MYWYWSSREWINHDLTSEKHAILAKNTTYSPLDCFPVRQKKIILWIGHLVQIFNSYLSILTDLLAYCNWYKSWKMKWNGPVNCMLLLFQKKVLVFHIPVSHTYAHQVQSYMNRTCYSILSSTTRFNSKLAVWMRPEQQNIVVKLWLEKWGREMLLNISIQ